MYGHAKNATFMIFKVFWGAKRYVGPPFRLLGGAMAGMPPPLDPPVSTADWFETRVPVPSRGTASALTAPPLAEPGLF